MKDRRGFTCDKVIWVHEKRFLNEPHTYDELEDHYILMENRAFCCQTEKKQYYIMAAKETKKAMDNYPRCLRRQAT